ncbi:SDR family oxidoreductase [Paenibacillus rigui]|uniref:dTDP-4-dehydrorhamnose reductase n=1 Tax=Paenibacillus rigui TaxID=554312 RepID=A0A229UJJ0_9BACL|nr:SDR family oxidoreductase [Paenibacillus rigui]OXM83484.1 NAD(P)-dependent oxidoreductase [Paenibacillus rigui]
MRVLVIGGNGMAGHLMVQYMTRETSFDLFYTVRQREQRLAGSNGLYLDARDSEAVTHLVRAVAPDIIVNCIGILNDFARLHEVEAYRINGLLPHLLAELADRQGARLIHISTDCVFSGERGAYEERHVPDGTSVYAKTKALGEVVKPPHVTIRTSIIGPEIRANGIGLLHWFMQQRGEIKGFLQVPWNGVTTLELAKFVCHLIEGGSGVQGLVHLTAARPLSKCRMLEQFQSVFAKDDVIIRPDDTIVLDRTLKNTRTDLGYAPQDFAAMLVELRDWMALR